MIFFFLFILFYSILSLHVLFLVLFFFFCSSHYHSFSFLLENFVYFLECYWLYLLTFTIITSFFTAFANPYVLCFSAKHSLYYNFCFFNWSTALSSFSFPHNANAHRMWIFFFFLFNCNCYSSVLLVLNFMWRKYSLNIDIWSSFVWFNNTKLHWSSKQNNKPKK